LTGLMRMPSSMCAESAWSETLCAITSLSHNVLTKVVLPARAPETGQPWLWLCCSAAGPAARRTGAGCADDHQAGKGKGAAVSTRRHRDAQGRAGSKPAHQNETPFFVARRMRDVMMGRGWRGEGVGAGAVGRSGGSLASHLRATRAVRRRPRDWRRAWGFVAVCARVHNARRSRSRGRGSCPATRPQHSPSPHSTSWPEEGI
jgi:hypothetical protein